MAHREALSHPTTTLPVSAKRLYSLPQGTCQCQQHNDQHPSGGHQQPVGRDPEAGGQPQPAFGCQGRGSLQPHGWGIIYVVIILLKSWGSDVRVITPEAALA